MSDMKPFLTLEDISVSYGSIKAVRGVSMQVMEGEIATMIGANGAGKTTIMRTIMGLKSPVSGKIYYEGQDITKWSTQQRVKAGLILSPEGRQVFPRFSVADNLAMGGYTHSQAENNTTLESVLELFPILKDRLTQPAGTLSGGEQQMLAVGRAMMGKPRLLLLDEPSLGLAPLIVKEIFGLVKRINSMGTTVLLVEQNAKQALRISHRGYVLETGTITLSGSAKELLHSDDVRKAYLGGI